jgi:cysteinyl-tRNA synthetase
LLREGKLTLSRNYVTFDIIRRVLEDYFGYEIFSVMNITDVDDKIILKARRQFLFDKYKAEHTANNDEVVKDLTEAWEKFVPSMEKKLKETTDIPEIKLLEEKIAEAKKTAAKVKQDVTVSFISNSALLTNKVQQFCSNWFIARSLV